MKYFEAKFDITPYSEVAADMLTALLGEAGFEAFVPADDGFTAYVQQKFYDHEATESAVRCVPNVSVTYKVCEAPDEDWNQTWEQEAFDFVTVDDLVCVHNERAAHPLPHCRYSITINPRMAFGSGTHPTTRQILRMLCEIELQDMRVIDAGCGTGVLGILATMRQAKHVFSYDIDSWSVENTLVNVALNGVSNIDVCEGDAGVLPQTGDYDLLIANINRNILLADMPRFVHALKPDGQLLLSGFYETDVPMLVDKGQELGLTPRLTTSEDGWAMLLMGKGR